MPQKTTQQIFLIGPDADWDKHMSCLADRFHALRRFDDAATFTTWIDYSRLPANACVAMRLKSAPLSGLDLLDILRADMVLLPVVLLARADELLDAVRTTRYDGVYTVWQPYRNAHLISAIERALREWDVGHDCSGNARPCATIEERIESLSMRQRQVLHQVFAGNANRAIAGELGISIKTVELHRACMMKKMQAASVVDLIRMLADFGRALQEA